MGFSRQENWSGLPYPRPADLPTQGSNPHLLWLLHYKRVCYRVQAHIALGKISQWIQDKVLRPGRDFIRELADQEDGRLATQNNHLSGLDVRFFYGSEIRAWWGNKVKRPFNSCKYLLEWQASGGVDMLVALPYSHFMGFPGGSDGKASACNAGDSDLIPGSERSPGEVNGNPLQYSCWKIPWMEEPGGLQSMGSQRVRHNWATSLHFTS